MSRQFLFALVLLLTTMTGCCLDHERWRFPNITHPGNIQDQTYNMSISDPLPSVGVGSKGNGLRPRDADLPFDPHSKRELDDKRYEDLRPTY